MLRKRSDCLAARIGSDASFARKLILLSCSYGNAADRTGQFRNASGHRFYGGRDLRCGGGNVAGLPACVADGSIKRSHGLVEGEGALRDRGGDRGNRPFEIFGDAEQFDPAPFGLFVFYHSTLRSLCISLLERFICQDIGIFTRHESIGQMRQDRVKTNSDETQGRRLKNHGQRVNQHTFDAAAAGKDPFRRYEGKQQVMERNGHGG